VCPLHGQLPGGVCRGGLQPEEHPLTYLRLGVEAVIADERLWCCTTCHVCEDRCPQMIDVTDMLTSLMNEAAKQGHIPDKVRSSAETILHTGRALLVSRRVDNMRKKLGLKPLIPVPVEEVEGILEKTGLAALIG